MTGSVKAEFSLPPLTLIVGGARSGKSAQAERLARGSGLRLRYIATAAVWDDEMAERIARHQQDRGEGWETTEAPVDLAPALAAAGPDSVTLIDCATLWLTNVMLGGHDLAEATQGLRAALAGCRGPVIVVSNEVGWGIVPENALARAFRDEQGRLNQRLAEQAGLVVTVIAGQPLALKGRLP